MFVDKKYSQRNQLLFAQWVTMSHVIIFPQELAYTMFSNGIADLGDSKNRNSLKFMLICMNIIKKVLF